MERAPFDEMWGVDPVPLPGQNHRVVTKIEKCLRNFLIQLKEEAPRPALKLPGCFGSKAVEMRRDGSRHFEHVLLTLSLAHSLLIHNRRSTKRDIYYQRKRVFCNQRNLDQAVTTICNLLQESRIFLNIHSTAKGLIAGDLRFGVGSYGEVRDCREGIGIPYEGENLHSPDSNAQFILVVEKDTVFQTLLDESFTRRFPSILITGKGYPDVQTRRMAKSLVDALDIPIFGLMDADPHGMEIFCVYKFGPEKRGYENENLELPQMIWLGVYPSDASSSFGIALDKDQLLPLSDQDASKVGKLLHRARLNGEERLVEELLFISSTHKKLEIEAISGLRDGFLSAVYLPQKLQSHLPASVLHGSILNRC